MTAHTAYHTRLLSTVYTAVDLTALTLTLRSCGCPRGERVKHTARRSEVSWRRSASPLRTSSSERLLSTALRAILATPSGLQGSLVAVVIWG